MAKLRAMRHTTKVKRVSKGTLRSALLSGLKAESGRKDISFEEAPAVAAEARDSVPLEQRAGYPVRRAKGSVDPSTWETKAGVQVVVDFARYAWLADDWGQGVKITKPTSHSTGTSGGTYTVIVAPDGTVFYHRPDAEKYRGKPFSIEEGFNGQVRLAQLQAQQAVQLARMQIKDASQNSAQAFIGTDPDTTFFKILSKHEQKHLAPKEDFHFCVISARRAKSVAGLSDIWMVQSQLLEAGVTPTWYVDEASLQDYKALGLKAVVGGKLTAARNKALNDAARQNKVCVQISDDISAWEYRHGPSAKVRTDDAQNAAHNAARRYIVSPVAAARFMLAKMRGAEDPKPRLGGVYMLGSCARTFAGEAFVRKNFILGDFFVADKSPVRFDQEMTLKEDYDFTCAHINAHGSVMRCNRMTLNVKHYSNAGGACTNRDKKGLEERRNIDILHRKWPGAFRRHPRRHNEVILQLSRGRLSGGCGGDGDDEEDADRGEEKKTASPSKGGRAERAKKQQLGRVRRTIAKRRGGLQRSVDLGEVPEDARIARTGKVPPRSYMAQRCKKAAGKTVGKVVGALEVPDGAGTSRLYRMSDLRYDLKLGYLSLI